MVDAIEELRRLEAEVRATVKARIDVEQRFANPEALQSATARAYRDRDAVTSLLLEEVRSKVAADIAAFHEEWCRPDQIARNIERFDVLLDEAPAHIREHRDAIVDDELPEVYRARARIAERLRSAGLASILPEERAGDGQR
ncbi:hypothetical protein [Mycobacterium kansasii]|uniref:hypothetical protein n=1 Tax=Mycobacterium kansasii TaxID=1768 RepID=UPI003A843FA7